MHLTLDYIHSEWDKIKNFNRNILCKNGDIKDSGLPLGCYYCNKIILNSLIKETTFDDCAICPYCNIDAICELPTKDLNYLNHLNYYMFCTYYGPHGEYSLNLGFYKFGLCNECDKEFTISNR